MSALRNLATILQVIVLGGIVALAGTCGKACYDTMTPVEVAP